MESVWNEFVVVDFAVHFLVKLGHDLVDFFLVEDHVAESQDIPELGHGEVPGAFGVDLLEGPPQVSPVTNQLQIKKQEP